MCKTKKIIAGILCAIVAGIGVIGINAQSVDAQTAASQGTIATAGMSLEQLQQIIEMLKQQIQQIILLLQQRTYVQPVCGNGVCETAKGETAANCSKDCGKNVNEYCVKEGMKLGPFDTCCAGLTPNSGGCSSAGCAPSFCHVCGNGICSEGENQQGCPKDCGCGNGKCETKENQINCPADCGNAQCALEYWPCWTSSAPNPFETDFAPKQCCAGLTCQMGAISGTCVSDVACAKEGEVFADANRQCCAGLIKTTTAVPCASTNAVSADSTNTVCAQLKYTCAKPPVITGCTGEGETISASKPQCCEGLVKIQRLGTNPSGGPEIAWSYYTCEKPTAINCAKEGEKIAGGYGGKVCCPGLTRIENGEIRDGRCAMGSGARCTKCGDGICGVGENICNCPADCGAATLSCDAKCKADNYESGLCKTWSGVGEVSYGNSYCSAAGEDCYCKINSPYSAYPICNRTLSGSPTAEEVAQCAAAKGAIYCGNGWCKCANCGFINQATTTPPNLGKIVCSYGLNKDQCKSAGGGYLCPENYSTTSVYLGAGSATTYYKSNCFCSCPAPLSVSPTTTSSSLSGGTQTSTVNLSGGTASTVYIGGGVGN